MKLEEIKKFVAELRGLSQEGFRLFLCLMKK